MSKRISIELKKNTYINLKERSEQVGCTVSNLIRAWLSNCGRIDEVKIHKNSSQEAQFVSYNIYLEDSLIDELQKLSKSLGIPRNILISFIIEGKLKTKAQSSESEPFGIDFSELEKRFDELTLDQLIYELLNNKPFKAGVLSGGIMCLNGRTLQLMSVTDYYFQKVLDKILPVPKHMIKIDIDKHDNLLTQAVHTKTPQISTRLKDMLKPVLLPAVWDRMQKFVGAQMMVVFPLFYQSECVGILAVGFHAMKYDVRTMALLEKHAKMIGELVGRKMDK